MTSTPSNPSRPPMSMLVCGGRDFNDRDAVFRALDMAHAHRPIYLIISGGARGADLLAVSWADYRGIQTAVIMADWDKLGKAAGPIRNQKMLDMKPDGVTAFPGNRGTADMCERAEAAGVPVWRPYG